MDPAEFHAAVYHVIRQIPPGKVTSYGHIAKLVGMPAHARHVGQALKFVSADIIPPLPWQRVLGSSGVISSRGPGTNGADRQRQALEAEGVEVTAGTSGDLRVNLRTYGWFPAVGTIDTGVQENEDDAGEEDGQQDDANEQHEEQDEEDEEEQAGKQHAGW
ncbi:hypothetical protein EIP91_004203 [Steccherinum ochraceum]|uniref:Methylated-DNA-[protein]-cysteine S-methyltransferase DNA binding domain-containing protein n=1 Tax=Steccherinum ochraceum TaxID=92696 RepID=A0A4R0RAB9_9APHY|nr:hypothetical protein EIP91_004203 [Steccherinum ochraceum]